MKTFFSLSAPIKKVYLPATLALNHSAYFFPFVLSFSEANRAHISGMVKDIKSAPYQLPVSTDFKIASVKRCITHPFFHLNREPKCNSFFKKRLTFKVSRHSGKDEVMTIEKQNPEFDLSGPQPARPDLRCYSVGDQDWVAATSEDEARRVLAEMNGDDPVDYADWDVEQTSEAMLDRQWTDEDPPHAECGCLRDWLAEATEPTYLMGTE